uniref:Uncharacterized protein n=1 Tax=Ditylum brightwellii TaxID=49249 RepID=A0A7S2EV65_9STRA|mmetsp:Transcript_9109/g.13556  ORF Transcript_9109/g.13556 Transcript_9109/m.13556 type:complete len:185 (+) Transcript_9109:71-625(+)
MKLQVISILSTLALCANNVNAYSTPSTSVNTSNRRAFFVQTAAAGAAVIGTTSATPAFAAAVSKDALVGDLAASKSKIEGIPELLDQGEWDKVRTILKTPPVNQLWNLGESKNTLVQLAKETGEFELLELKDELAISLQMCDQLTYDNAFVYFQPGNGKVKIKEPKDLANKAMSQIQSAIEMSN